MKHNLKPYEIHFAVFVGYLLLRIIFIDWSSVEQKSKLEELPVDCSAVINGSENGALLAKAQSWTHHFTWIEHELLNSKNICATIDKYMFFEKKPLSIEERDYPLAFGLVIYKDLVQVLLELSIFYQPQNTFCMTIDKAATSKFQEKALEIEKCFPNVKVLVGSRSRWGSFGILENVYKCYTHLTNQQHDWKYYQYLAGSDLPIRTNLEMVRIFKAMNGSINTDIEEFEIDRYRNMEGVLPPIPLYKSSMSVAIPREAANYMVHSDRVKKLLQYLKSTWIPDESFWSSVSGAPALIPVPGSIRAKDVIWMRRNFAMRPPEVNTVTSVGTSYIGRYQVWVWQKPCYGKITSWSCVYGVGDVEEIAERPELIAHKFYINFEPAGFMCLLKEVRRRSRENTDFDATSYSEMPTVELHHGKSLTQLKHPEWLLRSSFYNPALEK